MTAFGKGQDCEDLIAWIKKIDNHVYCVSTSTQAGHNELIWEKWMSVFHHIQKIHEGHWEHYQRCEHGELDAAQQKRWFRPSKAFTVITIKVSKNHNR